MNSIDWLEVIISLIGSAIIGYFISIWASKNYEKQKNNRELEKLKLIHKDSEGLYENYSHNGQELENKVSEAVLEYVGTNVFKIKVTTYVDGNAKPLPSSEIQVWKGRIWMEGIRNGDITFYYIKPERLKNQFGFKRLILSPDKNHLVLFGEHGYGIEKFSRVKSEDV